MDRSKTVSFSLKIASCILSCLVSVVLLSCGLETSYYLDAPTLAGTSPNYGTADKSLHFFCFHTSGDSSSGSFSCLGTEIYYRIYNNQSVMEQREAAIDALEDSAQRDSLVSYGYKTLNLAGAAAPSPLIAQTNCYVYIRLADYNTSNSPDYKAVICTSSVPMTRYESSATQIGVPRRSINASYGFDFGKDAFHPVPVSSDSDYYSSSATSAGTYYIDVYAVTVGKDTADGTMSYSGVLRLGSVSISTADSF